MKALSLACGCSNQNKRWGGGNKGLEKVHMKTELLIQKINQALPQTQCEKCDYPGCLPYATAIVKQGVAINRCQPGGQEVINAIALLTNKPVVKPYHKEPGIPQVARINEDNCIGCTLCIKACPVDAIIGSAKQLHTILSEACTGCGLCLPPCPTSCITFLPLDISKNTALKNTQKKLIYQSRYEAKQHRDTKQAQKQLKTHFDLTAPNYIQHTLANILNNDPK
jgi:electron transport complex protein RnfB